MWYTCSRCGKNLSGYHSLWRHKKNKICEKKSKTIQQKKAEYSGILPVKSDVESESNTDSDTGSNNSCKECGNTFTRKFNLKRHQKDRCKKRLSTNVKRVS